MKNLSWHSKLTLSLAIFLPLFFIGAALGTKIGLWSWMVGLGGAVFVVGPWLLGITALVALVSLIIGLLKKPRSKMVITIAILGLVGPVLFAGLGASAASKAGANPIHDIATDTADPPQFSAATLKERKNADANALSDYQTPLGELEIFQAYKTENPQLAIKSHAQIINDTYADLSPLPLGGASKADAVAAVAAAMGRMGFDDITQDVEAGRVEAVAESFWYGFKDDIVARVGENEIDFRSVSRVGRSDLGANAARIAELRELVTQQIGQR